MRIHWDKALFEEIGMDCLLMAGVLQRVQRLQKDAGISDTRLANYQVAITRRAREMASKAEIRSSELPLPALPAGPKTPLSRRGFRPSTYICSHPSSSSDMSSPTSHYTPASDSTNSDQEEGEAIGRFIERTIRLYIECLNNRTLDASDPIWADLIDPEFRAVAVPPFKLNFKEWVGHLTGLAKEYPAYFITIANMSTDVFLSNGYARTFVDFESRGIPEGVTKRSVTIDEFRLRNGKWRWFSGQATDGHEMGHTA